MADASPPVDALDLGIDLTIGQAATCRDMLLTAASDGRHLLTVDLSRVADFDSSGVQLLLAARNLMAERGGTLQVSGASRVVHDTLTVFGLADLLQPSPSSLAS
jgi:anti-sigma B factor antagonist